MVNRLEINLNAFSNNLNVVKKTIGDNIKIMPVLKADAYGHGAIRLAKKSIENNNVSMIAIGSPEEGIVLRQNGIKTSILALDGITKGYEEELVKHNISSVVSNIPQLNAFNKVASKLNIMARIHIKVDTGMSRLGVKPEQLPAFFTEAINKENIFIEGIMTHFAMSPDKTSLFTNSQINIFNLALDALRSRGYKIPLIHAANSGAILNYPDSYYNLVRPGIILYGALPSDSNGNKNRFEPVMQLKTEIIHINRIKKGESVSYNRGFIANKEVKIAAIPIGYSVGYNRLLSNKTEMIVRGKKVRQVGNICMDLSMIDVTNVNEVEIGDEVVLIGRQGNEVIKIEDVARQIGTIPYEVMCMIGNNVKRVYIGGES